MCEKLEAYVMSVTVKQITHEIDDELAYVIGSDKLTVINLFCQN